MSVEMITGAVGTTITRSSAARVTSTSVSSMLSTPLSSSVALSGRVTVWPTANPAKAAGSSCAVTTASGLSTISKKISRIRSSRMSTPVLTEASAIAIRAMPSVPIVPDMVSNRLFSAISPALMLT